MDSLTSIFNGFAVKIVLSAAIAVFAPFKLTITILFIMIVIDTVCGTANAVKIRRFSRRGFGKSIIKLVTYSGAIITVRLMEVGISPIVDTNLITHIIVGFFIVIEALSILRNLTLLGAPLPSGITKIILRQIKSTTIEELVNKNSDKQDYLQEIADMIDYQLPGIQPENMKRLLKIKFEEWANVITMIDMLFSEGNNQNNDLLYYRVSSMINMTRKNIYEKWRADGIPEGCIKQFNSWHVPRFEKWMSGIKNICYSTDDNEKKKKSILEKIMINLYQTIIDIQKGEVVFKGSCN